MISKFKKELKMLFIEGDLLVVSLSVYLGFVLQKFLESIVKNIFYPILKMVIPDKIFRSIKINGSIINIGDIITNFINLVVALIISYVIIRILLKHLD